MASPSSPSGGVAIIGSTGLVGSNILSTLLSSSSSQVPVHTITRREPKSASPQLHPIVDSDTTKWASALSSISPLPSTVFSALGTTRASAGGIQNQWKIDHDLNVELAKAAKDAGVRTYVFVSSAGTRSLGASLAPYSKMKIGVEDAVKDLDFEQGIILRPGAIFGQREVSRGVGEHIFIGMLNSLGYISTGLRDSLGQDAEVIARAAVRAAQLAEEGKAPGKYWILEQGDIVRLGRKEWPEEKTKS